MTKWARATQFLVFSIIKKGVTIWNLFLLSTDSDQEISEAMEKLSPPAKSEVFLFFLDNMYIMYIQSHVANNVFTHNLKRMGRLL